MNKRKILMICEAVLLVLSLCLFAVPKADYKFGGDSFESVEGIPMSGLFDVSLPGIYVDNSLMTSDEPIKVTTPVADLHPGSYKVRLNYLTDDHNNTFSASSDYNTYPVLITRTDRGLEQTGQAGGSYEFRLDTWQKVTGYQITFNFTGNGYLYAYGLEIVETNWWKVIVLLTTILIILAINLFLYMQDHLAPKEIMGYLYALGLAFIISMPMLGVFFITGHDAPYHMGRLEALAEGLGRGMIPLRVSNFWLGGRGYASSIFYGDLFMYPAAILRNLGASIQTAWKFYIVMMNVLTALISYYSFRKIAKTQLGSIIATTIYVLSAYRLTCMYIRFSVGDYSAQAFLPLVLYGMFRLYSDEEVKGLFKTLRQCLPLILGVSGLILTHIQTTLMAAIFVVGFALVNFKKTFSPKYLVRIGIALAGVLILNMWYIFPFLQLIGKLAFVEDTLSLGRYRANGAYFWQLFNLFPEGYGDSYPVFESFANGFSNEMPFTIGAGAIGVFSYLIMRISGVIKKKDAGSSVNVRVADKLLIASLLSIFMTTIYFPWDFIEQLTPATSTITQTLMCPWRWLGIAWALCSLMTGFAYECIADSKDSIARFSAIFAGIVITLSGVGASYFISTLSGSGWQYIYDENRVVEYNIMGGEYLPIGTAHDSFEIDTAVPGDGVVVSDFSRADSNYKINMNVTNNSGDTGYVDVPFLYYKGYRAVGDGQKLTVMAGDLGFARVMIPAGFDGSITVDYMEPWYWRIYEVISILALIALIYFACMKRFQNAQI